VFGRDTATMACPHGSVCLGHTTYRPHLLLAVVCAVAAVTLLLWAPVAATRLGHGRPLLRGGWRHPIDAVGLRYHELPQWRRVAIAIVGLPLVVWVLIIYQARRLLLGPPAR
jgi:hypothetical protein